MTQYDDVNGNPVDLTGMEAILDDLRRSDRVIDDNGEVDVLTVVTRNDESCATLDFEKFRQFPRRAKGFITVRTAQAFADYVNKHKRAKRTLIVADDKSVTAVFNHHQEEEGYAGWSDWGVKLELQYTPSWTGWKGLAGGYITQEAMADFLEENALDVVEPDAGHLLDVVTNLRLASASKIRKRVNLQNGAVRFEFEEDFQPAGGGEEDNGVLEVPPRITVRLQVFVDGDTFDVPMLLRYRVREGQIQWMFKFTGEVQKLFNESFDRMTALIASATQIPVYRGSLA